MKSPLRLVLLATLATVLISSTAVFRVSADTSMTADQLQDIQDNCSSIKTTLTRLSVSDTGLRADRGQFYESLATKLMDPFNSRLTSNHIGANNFISVTADYRSTLNSFRTDYRLYQTQLTSVLGMDCTKQPAAFASAVDDTRTKRSKVHSDVTSLNQYIVSYQTSIDTLLTNYSQLGNGAAK